MTLADLTVQDQLTREIATIDRRASQEGSCGDSRRQGRSEFQVTVVRSR